MVMAVSSDACISSGVPPAGIWGGLVCCREVDDDRCDDWCQRRAGAQDVEIEALETLRHSFSHYDLDISRSSCACRARPKPWRTATMRLWYRLDGNPPGGIAAPVKKLIDALRSSEHDPNG